MTGVLSTPRVVAAQELEDRLGPIDTPPQAANWRDTLRWVRAQHGLAFREQTEATELIAEYTEIVDCIIRRAWAHAAPGSDCALLAVGGYGRGELLPQSDIDVLILVPEELGAQHEAGISQFVSLCWDCGLELGHGVRSLAECASEAAADVTILTNLMEGRYLCGDSTLAAELPPVIASDRCWSPADFFAAKRAEQAERYLRYDETGYKLEPNVKEGPGGLRDVQIICWLSQRLHGTGRLENLAEQCLLTQAEVSDLLSGRNQLWKVRYALHMLTERREDRLLFDHQVRISELYGYTDEKANLAVEQFMQLYYRTIKMLSCLNDIFMQLFEQQLNTETLVSRDLDEHFAIRGAYIAVRHSEVFRNEPLMLLRIFKLWAEHEAQGVRGIEAETLRLMRRDRNLIDADFRQRSDARALFLRIVRMDRGVLHTLRRLNRYGILGRYLPGFGTVIGRMQYDLFHQLTVDEHTLFVVRNIRRLAVPEYRHEFPELSDMYCALPKPELLTLAGLFHDIAKGRGGDHSELGAEDAINFCQDHGLSSQDGQTVAWLVQNHLLMSLTAQREDVSDPAVVNAFVAKLPDGDHLDLIYLLTVCDIRATNPKLWNGFRAGLLRSLYVAARRSLDDGEPLRQADLLDQRHARARVLCEELGLTAELMEAVWVQLDTEHLLRHSAEELAWHCTVISHSPNQTAVAVREVPERGTVVFMYSPDQAGMFAVCTAVLAQLGLNILDARISSGDNDWTASSYAVSETDGSDVNDAERRSEIRNTLLAALKQPEAVDLQVRRRLSARQRHFDTPTQIFFRTDPQQRYNIMELVANDRPGLLSSVGAVLRNHALNLRSAKIGTIGERAEDLFHFTGQNGKPIADTALFHSLRAELSDSLAEH